jgi:hypothetical protein
MKLPKELTTVTPTSKITAAIVFVTLPFIAFFLGIQYQTIITRNPSGNLTPSSSKSSAENQTSDWKTYVNNEFKYSVKYPSNWVARDITNESVATGLDSTGNNTFEPLNEVYKRVMKENVDSISSFIDSNDEEKILPKKPGEFYIGGIILHVEENGKLDLTKGEKIKVSGVDAVSVQSFNPRLEVNTIKVSFEKDGNVFTLSNSFTGYGSEYFDQILSTFKFLDENETIDTSNWKTYTNTQLNFSFKYPPTSDVKGINVMQTMKLCDLNKLDPQSWPEEGLRFGACEGSGITPTASVVENEFLISLYKSQGFNPTLLL